ncbi:MAG: C39 family peptidase [Candidatus Woesearchaeota archaeon]
MDIIPLFFVVTILLLGYFFSKVFSRFAIKVLRNRKNVYPLGEKETVQTIIEKVIILITIIIAIIYIGSEQASETILSFLEFIPTLLYIILMFVLGSLAINIVVWSVKKLLHYTRTEEIFTRESRAFIIPIIIFLIRLVLYLVLADIIFSFVDFPAIKQILDFLLYPLIIMITLFITIAFINPIRDFSARIYLLNMIHFRKGNTIRLDGRTYQIKSIQNFYTELYNESKGYRIIPNRIMASKEIDFKKPMKELESLQALKDAFVPQKKSHCGPATVQMALSLFNYSVDQQELGAMMRTRTRKSEKEKIAGTHPKALTEAIERITKKKVLARWIGFDRIYDLKRELIVWLNQGALVIVDYKKKYLFPDAKFAHYSLVTGVRGDELLMIDPSQVTGGVYFSDYRDILIGMDTYSDLIKGKRGYIVMAPKGTEAYERIRSNAIYYHRSMYARITKGIEVTLSKMSNPTAISETIPKTLQKYIRQSNQIKRLWKPDSKNI